MELSDILKTYKRCVFYGRYSSDKQDMDYQISRAEEFSKKYEIEIVKKYLDEAVSATRKPLSKRQRLNELIDDLSNDLFDFVVVYKIDRMARDVLEIEEVRSILSAANKPIVILDTEPPTLDEEPGDIFGFLKSSLAQFEVAQNRERTRDKGAAGAKSGKHQGGKAPFGYVYNKKEKLFEQVPEEILLVKKVFELYLQGDGFRKIAKVLPPNSYKGKNWTKDKVQRIINNPKYAGYISWGDRYNHIDNKNKKTIIAPLEGIEPVISKIEWDRCQEQLGLRIDRKVDPKFLSTSYLLRDLVICIHCNSKLVVDNQETDGGKFGHRLYICENDSCKSLRLKVNYLDRVIKNRIRTELILHNSVSTLIETIQSSFNNDIKKINDDIKIAEEGKKQYLIKMDDTDHKVRKLSRLQYNDTNRSLIESFTLYRIEVQTKYEFLEQQIETMKNKIDNIKDVLSKQQYWIPVLQTIEKQRENISNTEWRLLITEIVDSVLISKQPKSKNKYKIELKLKYDLSSIRFTYDEELESKRTQLTIEDIS